MDISQQILSQVATYMKYARHLPDEERRETYEEIVDRLKAMHLRKFPFLEDEINEYFGYVYRREVLPSMRSMQFGGVPIQLANNRMYNCAYMPIDHPDAFSEAMFLLLGGTGVGYSVQGRHIKKLPEITVPIGSEKFVVPDSIEGWSLAVRALIDAYLNPEQNYQPYFDFSEIRAKGEPLVTSGGRAPGPEPLRKALVKVHEILSSKRDGSKLRSIEVHDIMCHVARAVLSGGIRRSAMISLFSFNDWEMRAAKSGEWYKDNPQRSLANNSAIVERRSVNKQMFQDFMNEVESNGSGEPGIYWTNDLDWGTNPCVEIGLQANQFCNVTDINTATLTSSHDLINRARAAAFIGTLQATYTDFHFLRPIWKKRTDEEALIGVGATGIGSGKFMNKILSAAVDAVRYENRMTAKKVGINQAARLTCVKPSGTSSIVLGTSSGVHGWHAPYYLRRMTVQRSEPIYQYLKATNPDLLEESIQDPEKAFVVIPQKAPDGAIFRDEPMIDMLNRVKRVNEEWVHPGHNSGINPHNVSATVSVKDDEWNDLTEWMWNNRRSYSGLAVMPYDGGSYVQTPFEEITEEEYKERYANLERIDLTQISELEDLTDLQGELACSGDSCEIT